MISFPFVHSEDRLITLFELIKENPVPKKFTYRYLAKIGLSSSNDRKLLPVLKFLDLLDEKSVPTEDYIYLRDPATFENVLTEKVATAYKPIFELDTNATLVPIRKLEGYFSRFANTPRDKLTMMATTFKKLCDLAGMPSNAGEPKMYGEHKLYVNGAYDDFADQANQVTGTPKEKHLAKEPQVKSNKITFELPETTNEDVYKALFNQLKQILLK